MHALSANIKANGSSPRGERGFVLIISLMILATLTIAMGAIATAALHTSTQGTRQSSTARALAAADAGAQVALFRLNTTGGSTGSTGSMGNGASYTYAVSSLSSSSSACAGLWLTNSSQTLNQDCITSTGTVDGVSQRVQERVSGYQPQTSLFPVNGVFAINGFTSAGSAITGTFDLGSNGTLGLSNNDLSTLNGTIEYLSGKLNQSQNSGQQCTGTCKTAVLSSAVTVPSVAASVWTSAATTNSDLTGITYSNGSYNSTTHVLSATNNSAVITFAPGTYYFCGINEGGFNSVSLATSGAGLVKIYIDSPYDSSGSCTSSQSGYSSSWGTIYNAGNATSINSGGVSSNLQLYFYGNPSCTGSNCPAAVSPLNGWTVNGDVFAPYSSMDPGNAFTMTGALVVNYLTAQNAFSFTYAAPSSSGSSSSTTTYYPAAHQICIPSTTSGGTAGSC